MNQKTNNKQKLGSHPMSGMLISLHLGKILAIVLLFIFIILNLQELIIQTLGKSLNFNGHGIFLSYIIATLILSYFIFLYLKSIDAVFYTYSGGLWDGWGARISSLTIFFFVVFLLFKMSSLNYTENKKVNIKKAQTHSLINSTAVTQYQTRINIVHQEIVSTRERVKQNNVLLDKFTKLKAKAFNNQLHGTHLVDYERALKKDKELRADIKGYLASISQIEKEKQLQKKELKTHNSNEKTRFLEEVRNAEVSGYIFAGLFEAGIFFLSFFIKVYRADFIEIKASPQKEVRSLERPSVIESVYLEGALDGTIVNKTKTIEKVQKTINSESSRVNKLKKSIAKKLGFTPIEQDVIEKKEAQEQIKYKKNTPNLANETPVSNPKIKKTNGVSHRKVIKKWTPTDAYNLPKLMNLDKEEFSFEMLTQPTEKESKKLAALSKKSSPKGAMLFELMLVFFYTNIDLNIKGNDRPLVARADKILNMNGWTPIIERYGVKNGNVQRLLADLTKDETCCLSYKNLVLVQKEPIQVPTIQYTQ